MTAMRILIIAEDLPTQALLARCLTDAGFISDCASEVKLAVSLARCTDYVLVLVDSALRGIAGAALVRHLRSIGIGTPVLLLADSELPLEPLLAIGADDVLFKAVMHVELLPRVAALLRTFAGGVSANRGRLCIADLELDTIRRRSFRAHRELELTQREFSTLELLMSHHGEVVPRTRIATVAAVVTANCDDAVDAHIGRLRRKVDGTARRKLLHTVRGVGFVLEERSVAW